VIHVVCSNAMCSPVFVHIFVRETLTRKPQFYVYRSSHRAHHSNIPLNIRIRQYSNYHWLFPVHCFCKYYSETCEIRIPLGIHLDRASTLACSTRGDSGETLKPRRLSDLDGPWDEPQVSLIQRCPYFRVHFAPTTAVWNQRRYFLGVRISQDGLMLQGCYYRFHCIVMALSPRFNLIKVFTIIRKCVGKNTLR
jgi:hypothetical protein